MLRDEQIVALEAKCTDRLQGGGTLFHFLEFARAVERAAYKAAIKACLNEHVDADATRCRTDEAYNAACVHCSEAIRSLMQERPR